MSDTGVVLKNAEIGISEEFHSKWYIGRKNQHNSRFVFHKLVSDVSVLHQCTKWLIVLNVTRK